MKTFIARQPILNAKGEITSYELLFRSAHQEHAVVSNDYEATMKVISDLIIDFGVDRIVNNKRFFINFSNDLLLHDAPNMFRCEQLVIELLETAVPNEKVIAKLKEYKKRGYLIALDDFSYTDSKKELCEIADIVKIDFLSNSKKELMDIVKSVKPFNVRLLAEKVETKAEFDYARDIGFTIFQGYYFQKPTILESKRSIVIPNVYVELMNELSKKDVNFNRLEGIVKHDNQLVVTLLRLLNAASFYSNSKVTSIRDALVRLGVNGSKNLFLTNMLKNLHASGVASSLILRSLIRGKMAELLAGDFGYQKYADGLFLVGTLSLINVILNKPMSEIVKDLPLNDDIIFALMGERNLYSEVLEVIILHEMEMVDDLSMMLNVRQIAIDDFNQYYLEANTWSDQIWNV